MKVNNDGTLHVEFDAKDKVKPCPFCGAQKDVRLANTWTPSYWIECVNCGAEMHPAGRGWKCGEDMKSSVHLASARRALKWWNMRHHDISESR